MTTKQQQQQEIPWAWIKCIHDKIESQDYVRPSLPVEIVPSWLYLSDEFNVHNTQKLKMMGVTHVLSTNIMPKTDSDNLSKQLNESKINHKYIPGEDEEGYKFIEKHWDDCRSFIESARNGGKIVIHCAAGINRSGLMVCAAHMVLERCDVVGVVMNCLEKRGSVLWNKSFQRQLCELAMKEGLLGDKPLGYDDLAPKGFLEDDDKKDGKDEDGSLKLLTYD